MSWSSLKYSRRRIIKPPSQERLGDHRGDGFRGDGTLESIFEIARECLGGGSLLATIWIGKGKR